ncbi:MAG TPA: universal stress protein [Xanthobacteraceae bacterium]|nr:universal stress protein [Xanthobacteraceae bacterium]
MSSFRFAAPTKEANRWPADLIVIGTHGRRGIRRVFLGSVAEGLARISPRSAAPRPC